MKLYVVRQTLMLIVFLFVCVCCEVYVRLFVSILFMLALKYLIANLGWLHWSNVLVILHNGMAQ